MSFEVFPGGGAFPACVGERHNDKYVSWRTARRTSRGWGGPLLLQVAEVSWAVGRGVGIVSVVRFSFRQHYRQGPESRGNTTQLFLLWAPLGAVPRAASLRYSIRVVHRGARRPPGWGGHMVESSGPIPRGFNIRLFFQWRKLAHSGYK